MTLSKRLESQINYLFVVVAALGFFALGFNTFISVAQVREKAANLIVSHLREIAMAGVTAQSMSDIDREAARLSEVWRSTQDIDMRSDIYIDGQLIAHAGQLQKFGLFSSAINQSFNLPSSQKLQIDIELDLGGTIFYHAIIALIFCAFLCGCYVLLRSKLFKTMREMTAPIEHRANWLMESGGRVQSEHEYRSEFQESPIDEIKSLDLSLMSFIGKIKRLEYEASQNSYDLGRLKMAEQLAHNLRGPLASLQMRISALNLSNDQKSKLNEGVNNILASSQNLLSGRKAKTTQEVNVVFILEKVISDLSERFSSKASIQMHRSTHTQVTVIGNASEIESMLRNILENSIEAIQADGKINVNLNSNLSNAEILVEDNGCGIPEDRIPMLMKEGATFGKVNGNGLGLWHADNTIQALGGSIRLKSKVGHGTRVLLNFPIKPAESEVSLVEVGSTQTVVILDDDPLIHQSWGIKLRDIPVKKVNLFSVKDFENWMSRNGEGDFGGRIYFMDYDLKDERVTGIDLIKKYGLSLEARLVTGMADDVEVGSHAKQNRIRVISKSNLADIKISVINSSDERQINGPQ